MDIIKYFNEGGALAYSRGLKTKDLSHHSSHDDKVSFLEIQDIHIIKMNNNDKESLAGRDGAKEFTFNIFDKE